MQNQALRLEKFAGRFLLPSQPNGAMQSHSMLPPGYRSVGFFYIKCTVGILRIYCHSICAETNLVNTEFYASRKRTIMAICRLNG